MPGLDIFRNIEDSRCALPVVVFNCLSHFRRKTIETIRSDIILQRGTRGIRQTFDLWSRGFFLNLFQILHAGA